MQLKILIAFAQMVLSLRDVFDLTFPKGFGIIVKHIMSWLSLRILGHFVGLECFFQTTLYERLAVKTLGPLVVILFLVALMRCPIREVTARFTYSQSYPPLSRPTPLQVIFQGSYSTSLLSISVVERYDQKLKQNASEQTSSNSKPST